MGLEVYLRFVAALGFTLGLIGLAWWAARRWSHVLPMRPMGPGRRLGVVEVNAIDSRRRLVLVRRDDTEHLLLLGPTSETVVERGIPAAPRDGADTLGATPERLADRLNHPGAGS